MIFEIGVWSAPRLAASFANHTRIQNAAIGAAISAFADPSRILREGDAWSDQAEPTQDPLADF
jgi:hypothetical protein